MQIAHPTSRAIPRVAAPSAAIKTMRALTRTRYSVFVERARLFARQYNRGRLFCSGVPVPWRLRDSESH